MSTSTCFPLARVDMLMIRRAGVFDADRVHRVDEQVEQYLLQLHRIAGGRRQLRSQSSFDVNLSLDQLAVHETQCWN